MTVLDFLYNVKDETVLWNILSFVACERVNVGLWLSENFESGVDLTSFVPVAELVKGDEFLAIGSDQDILIRELENIINQLNFTYQQDLREELTARSWYLG